MTILKRYFLLLGVLGGLPQCTTGADRAATPSPSVGGVGVGGSAGSGAGMVSGGAAGEVAGASGSASANTGGSAGTSSGAPNTGGSGGGAGTSSEGGAPATATCSPSKPQTAGDTTETFDFGGKTRDYIVHVPPGYDGSKPVPLVVDLHGYTSWAAEQAERTKWSTKADSETFVVVHPDGVDKSWNADICCGNAQATDVDDVAFIREVVSRVSTGLCLDSQRVYLSGHSNGGFMTFKLGCEAADLFAAIAPVAGVTPVPGSCEPSRPLPVVMMRALSDPTIPYEGKGTGAGRYQSAQEDVDTWLALNECETTPVVTSRNGVCKTYSQCAAGTEVELCSPRGDHLFFFADAAGNPDDVRVPEVAWEFFSRHSL